MRVVRLTVSLPCMHKWVVLLQEGWAQRWVLDFFRGVSESDALCPKSFLTTHSCEFIIMESINTFEPKCCAGRRRLYKWAFVRSSSLILPNWMYLVMSTLNPFESIINTHKAKYFLDANACLHGLSHTEALK